MPCRASGQIGTNSGSAECCAYGLGYGFAWIPAASVKLKGELKGLYVVTVKANWRVIFRFDDGEAEDVDYLDYH